MTKVQAMRTRLAIAGLFLLLFKAVQADDEFEKPPIEYSLRTPVNRVSALQAALEQGQTSLRHDAQFGYLPDLLNQLQVPRESQVLVFSKTSLQIARIGPRTPRAIYFNDEISIGYAHAGDLLEITAVDPQLGLVFYTLEQDLDETPVLLRQTDRCLTCHSSTRTDYVPGLLARSLIVDLKGHPIFSASSSNVDHRTPFEKRWGGWYVTGTHGGLVHQGNFFSKTRNATEPIDNAAGQNVTDLATLLTIDRYLTKHSDIVALMVFEHQVLVQNCLTKANFSARQALHYQQVMSDALKQPSDVMLESVTRRIRSAAEDLVEAMLLVDEAPLTAPIMGTSGFAKKFQEGGPRDSQSRSLRDLDLQTRLFRYPCSFLINSTAFAALPEEIRESVWQQFDEILTGRNVDQKYAHLSPSDRKAIREILISTHPGVPSSWTSAP